MLCCLTSYFHSGSSSLRAINPFGRQELCLCRERHRGLQGSPLSFIIQLPACSISHQSSLSLKAFGNSQVAKNICTHIGLNIHTYIFLYNMFIYNSRFCIGTGCTDVKARPQETCSNGKSKSGMIAARYGNTSFAKALNPNVISDSQYLDM